MSSSILNIGVQALNANQTALSYVGQNIANVNTEGYSRQTVLMGTQDPPILGVEVKDINRVTDQFLISQVWRDTSTFSSNEAFSEKIALLDKMLVSESTSLSAGMDKYFSSLQQVVDDPLFIANRELFLAEAQTLANQFNDFDSKLQSQGELINTEVRSMIANVNSITENIAALNVQINTMVTAGQNANELMDRRDQLVKDLSGYISTSVISQDGVSYNVMMGDGQPLVVGSGAATLQLRNSDADPSQLDIYMTSGSGVDAKVTNQLGEGAIGGMVRYRNEVLQPTINEVGRLAIVFSDSMNQLHRAGMDLNGDLGQDLFYDIQSGEVIANARNKNLGVNAYVDFYNTSALTASDYKFEVTGVDSFQITRLSDGKRFVSSDFTEVTSTADLSQSGVFYDDPSTNTFKLSIDGVTLTLKGATAVGDSYTLQPTRTGAQLMDVEITNPKMLALASPIRVEPASTNSGNAEVQSVVITDPSVIGLDHAAGTPALEIVFNAPNGLGETTYTVFNTEDPNNPVALTSGVYTAGETIAFSGFELTFENQPNAGDRFTVEPNTNGYSDNSNALAMSNLQNEALLGGFSYQEVYGQLLAKVGTQASTAEISYNSSRAVLASSENALQSVAGVNLDEEAANLVKYQQAYSASAQLISAYQTIFDSLIAAVRR